MTATTRRRVRRPPEKVHLRTATKNGMEQITHFFRKTDARIRCAGGDLSPWQWLAYEARRIGGTVVQSGDGTARALYLDAETASLRIMQTRTPT